MTIKHRTVHQILSMSIMSFFLFGCMGSIPTTIPTPVFTPSSDQMDKSPFTGIPCAAPCWHGLEVGKSTESEVTSILPTLTFINHETIQTYHVSMPNYNYSASAPGVLIEASCANSGRKCLTLSVIDNVLTDIEVGLNYDIRADQAIGYLGNPNYVGYDNIGSERVICEVYLVWNDSRFVLASRFEGVESSNDVEKY